jgi:hypothetical protein
MAGIPKRILHLKRRRKKIRGFNRFLRDHQQRAAIPEELVIDYLRQYHYDYEKLGLAPWAVNDKPPLVIRKLWVSRLVTDYYRWHEQLSADYQDFYLAVWLYNPEFGRSQLVAGIEEKQTWYEGVFDESVSVPLPTEYQSIPGVAALHWTARAEVQAYWPNEFAELGSWALNRPHWEAETTNGEPFFTVQIGTVWVGQQAS